MYTDNILKLGFVEDKIDTYLNKMELDNNIKHLSEVHIDVYPENPLISSASSCFELMLRTSEKNVLILIDNDRIILKRNDIYGTHFLNVLIPKIKEFYSKVSDSYLEFILNIHDVYYRINIIN